jgi:hypothetical protein
MSLVILFGETAPETDRRKFVREKLEFFFNSKEDQEENVNIVCSYEPAKLSVLEKKDFPQFAAEQLQELRDAEACFLKEVNYKWHGGADEKIIEDLITYSTSTTSEIRFGTPVLRRTTNLGTVYFARPDLAFTDGIAKERGLGSALLVISSGLLIKFAEGIARSLGSKLIEEIFGNCSNIDTKQLCQELAIIVKDANAEQTVQEQSGKIESVQHSIKIFYKNKKDIYPDDRVALTQLLLEQRNSLMKAVNILQQDSFKRKGISVFVVGANVMLSILQEMAFVDPQQKDYKKSEHYKSFRDILDGYIIYLRDIRKLITDERLAKVTEVGCKKECIGVHGDTYCSYHCRYKDEFLSKGYDFTDDSPKNKNPKPARQKADESRNALVAQLRKELNWMDEIVADWEIASKKAKG